MKQNITHLYKAVFIDMDGTMLQSDHTISDANKEILISLQQKGIMVAPVSARPLHGMLPILKGVINDNMPVVSLNGSYIFQSNEIIRQFTIPLSNTIAIHSELLHDDVTLMYYSQMDWFAAAETELVQKEQRITPVKIQIEAFEQIVTKWKSQNNGPNKILIAGDAGLVALVEQNLLGIYNSKLNIYKSQPKYLEVMNRQASKTSAIEFLIKKYDIAKQDVIAIGDNYNDKEMIEFAGTGVAMGNAPDDIKQVADYVTDTNNADGVAKHCIISLDKPPRFFYDKCCNNSATFICETHFGNVQKNNLSSSTSHKNDSNFKPNPHISYPHHFRISSE